MTLAVDGNPQQTTGTGANTALGTVFKYFTATDVVVEKRITATGVQTTLVKDTHYTLTGGSTAGATGTVTPIDGATDFPTTVTWIISRAIPLTQSLDYVPNESFPAASHEAGLDRAMMVDQDTGEQSDRSLRFPMGDDALISLLPNFVDRASKFLSFDASGNAVVAAAPAATGTGKVLLDTATETAASLISVTSTNWPTGYDRVELEFVGLLPSAAAAHMVIQPVDNGSATTTNLRSESVVVQGASVAATNSSSAWLTNTTSEMTNAADDALNGHAIFTVFGASPGMLSGVGHYSYLNGTVMRGDTVFYRRVTTAGTRWDGFEVSMDTGNITGTIRLWGLPKA